MADGRDDRHHRLVQPQLRLYAGDGERYLPTNTQGSSTLELPVAALDTPLDVVGDTVAMSTPHEIEYTLTFTLRSKPHHRRLRRLKPMKAPQFSESPPAAALAARWLRREPQKTAPANTASHQLSAGYAAGQFSADCYEGGICAGEHPGQRQIPRDPRGREEVDDLPADVLLRQPLDNIYLVSTSVMDLFVHLDALDCIALSAKAEGWYVGRRPSRPCRRAASPTPAEYSAPDYEADPCFRVQPRHRDTMILHDPAVKEQLEKFGVPVLIGALEL